MIREVGADHLVFGSDLGQVHNVRHVVGIDWFVRYLLSYKVPEMDIVKIMRTNPARHVGLETSTAYFNTTEDIERLMVALDSLTGGSHP